MTTRIVMSFLQCALMGFFVSLTSCETREDFQDSNGVFFNGVFVFFQLGLLLIEGGRDL